MATLSDNERRDVWAEIMADLSRDREACGLTKAEVRAIVDAADAFLDANAAAYNSTIPAGVRGKAGASLKARALMKVIALRYVKGA